MVAGCTASVSAGVALFAGGNRDDQAGLGQQSIALQPIVPESIAARVFQVVSFGDGFRGRVIGVSYGGERFTILDFVVAPPDALVGGIEATAAWNLAAVPAGRWSSNCRS